MNPDPETSDEGDDASVAAARAYLVSRNALYKLRSPVPVLFSAGCPAGEIRRYRGEAGKPRTGLARIMNPFSRRP